MSQVTVTVLFDSNKVDRITINKIKAGLQKLIAEVFEDKRTLSDAASIADLKIPRDSISVIEHRFHSTDVGVSPLRFSINSGPSNGRSACKVTKLFLEALACAQLVPQELLGSYDIVVCFEENRSYEKSS